MANAANSGGKWIRQDKRLAIYLRDDHTCLYCGCGADEIHDDGVPVTLTLDHVTPQALGGSNGETNLVAACKRCNSAKGALRLSEFLAYLADQGRDTEELGPRIRRHTRRSIKRHRARAKAIIARRAK